MVGRLLLIEPIKMVTFEELPEESNDVINDTKLIPKSL